MLNFPSYKTQVNNWVAVVDDAHRGIIHEWVTKWCEEQGIDAEFVGMWMITDGEASSYSLWKIKDPAQRTAFSLKWGYDCGSCRSQI